MPLILMAANQHAKGMLPSQNIGLQELMSNFSEALGSVRGGVESLGVEADELPISDCVPEGPSHSVQVWLAPRMLFPSYAFSQHTTHSTQHTAHSTQHT